ncbi:muconate/chloromuconate family cycloisomerase [Methylobacterium nodulans]|uniref:Muconate and chloromuconate cycloisomerase n=1 Tax=Methylobacterium nodulans (strain LMG 21967 / CNCM I-2342 / ORS 2060) TaxID=460265 RepID=B8IBD3_METNO|nr:muconate/chloromuconate family cycloisomerase [Methylobacterium nodulans]ACL57348.1 muconate and chloromuconate cycloisomerase [Methylobacterium nodulans ORS 2060]
MLAKTQIHDHAAGSPARDLAVAQIRATIVDVPTVRQHKLSQTSVTAQSYVIVQVRLENGVEGIGEAATLGGPRWSEESVEGIKATIDAYLAPALIGQRADHFVTAGLVLDAAAKRNNAAKAAIETALFDAVGKTLGLPAAALLGGAVRSSLPVLWTLASGDPDQEIAEAHAKLDARLHRTFKIKIGAQAPEADLARLTRLAAALADRATLIVDANQAWDETTARRFLPRLRDLKIALVEQPLPAWNIAGMGRLRTRDDSPPLLADECVFTAHDMLAVAQGAAADAVSLKLVKHGGLIGLRKVAAVAEAAGIGLYGGCLLESSIGAAAHLQAFAGLRDLAWGCEHFGPQILTDDLVTEPLRFHDFEVHLPAGPGLGVTLDPDKLRHYARS